MKRLSIIILSLLISLPSLLFAQQKKFVRNENLPLADTAKFDIYKYQFTVGLPDGRIDTTVEIKKIPRKAHIFRKGRVYHYRAIYRGANKDTLSDRAVDLVPTGFRWAGSVNRQVEIQYEYELEKEDTTNFSPHPLNPSYGVWRNSVRVAAMENQEECWMRPMRHNQYIFTQVAPFPEVRFPLKKGKKWSSLIRMRNYGIWSGHEGEMKYKVLGEKEIDLPFQTSLKCWKINAEVAYSFGASRLTYYFHPDYGFVKMEYRNYAGEYLEVIMQDHSAEES